MLIVIVYLDSPTDDNFHQIKKGNFGRQKLLFTFFLYILDIQATNLEMNLFDNLILRRLTLFKEFHN